MRNIGCVVLICSWMCLSVSAAQSNASVAEQSQNLSTIQMEFSRPQIIADLNARPTIAGRFDCGQDGSIYTFIDGYAPYATGTTPKQRLALLAIHPDGSVTNFPWRSVTGFSDISLPKSVFVGNGYVSILLKGRRDPALGEQGLPYPLVLTFNQYGNLIHTAILEQGLDPLVLGVFKSGNMVVISEDRLNLRMALDLVNPDGVSIRQLDLGTNDYLAQASKIADANRSRRYNPMLLIAMSKFFPFGNHLLLLPLETVGLPVVELSEQGVVKAVVPQLPKGMVLDSYIASDESLLKVRLGTIVETQHPAVDTQGNLVSVGTTPSRRITELSLTDGSIRRETDISSDGVQPACEAGGALRLLTSNGTVGKLAVVAAHLH